MNGLDPRWVESALSFLPEALLAAMAAILLMRDMDRPKE